MWGDDWSGFIVVLLMFSLIVLHKLSVFLAHIQLCCCYGGTSLMMGFLFTHGNCIFVSDSIMV